jgi:SAM-dependent methyltransferase
VPGSRGPGVDGAKVHAPVWGEGLTFEAAQRVARVTSVAQAELTRLLVDAAEPREGLRVLDLACGPGTPTLDLARRVAPSGDVVGLDISAPSIALARQFAAAQGVTNVAFLEGDAEALPLPDAAFDRVTSAFGPMFFREIPRTLAEVRRVLRPGGRVAWLVWGPAEENTYFRHTALVALRRSGAAELDAEAGRPFRFAPGGALEAALRAAGLAEVQETRHGVGQVWPTTPDRLARRFWETPPPPFRALVDRLPPREREAGLTESTEAFARHAADGPVRLEAVVRLGVGTEPSPDSPRAPRRGPARGAAQGSPKPGSA